MTNDKPNEFSTKMQPLLDNVRQTDAPKLLHMRIDDLEAAMIVQEEFAKTGPLGTVEAIETEPTGLFDYEQSMYRLRRETVDRKTEQYQLGTKLAQMYIHQATPLRFVSGGSPAHESDDNCDPDQKDFLIDTQKSAAVVEKAFDMKTQLEAHRYLTAEMAEMRYQLRRATREIRVLTEDFLPVMSPPVRGFNAEQDEPTPDGPSYLDVVMAFGVLRLKIQISDTKPGWKYVEETIDIFRRNYIKRVIEEHERVFNDYIEKIATGMEPAITTLDKVSKLR